MTTVDVGRVRGLVAASRLDGAVTLSSGVLSSTYYDLRPLSLHPDHGPLAGRVLWELVAGWEPQAVAGPALGGVPLAVHTAVAGRVPALMVRSAAKEHGLGHQVEGCACAGFRVVIVDDVVTSGGSLLRTRDALLTTGADVVGCAVLLDRGFTRDGADRGFSSA